MRKFLIPLTILFMASCSTPQSLIGPDGTTHYVITCGYIEKCYKDARKVCDGNYKIVNTTTSVDVFNGLRTQSQDLLIKCDQ